jgi:DNA-binding NarL/FixJ family response regulator
LKIAALIIQENQKNEQRLRFQGFKTNFSSKISDSIPKFTDLKENGFFTNREKQVLKLSAEGAPIKQIAQQMGISVRTVEKHRSNIFRKTNSENIVEAVFYANRKHLLEIN